MATPEAATEAASTKKKSGKLIYIIVAVVAIGSGSTLPLLIMKKPAHADELGTGGAPGGHGAVAKKTDKKHDKKGDSKPAFVPFGDVLVNLSEDKLTRYLRVKLVLVVDSTKEKAFTDDLTKYKAVLKSWLISHLSEKTLADVGGASGVNRAKREIFEHFKTVLSPDGSEDLTDVLFDEFVVQ